MTQKDKRLLKAEQESTNLKPAMARDEKIAQFKREKATKSKLKELNEWLLATDNAHPDQESLEREIILTTIDLFIQTSIASIAVIKEELQLLDYAKNMKDTRNESSNESRLDNLEGKPRTFSGPLLNASGKVMSLF